MKNPEQQVENTSDIDHLYHFWFELFLTEVGMSFQSNASLQRLEESVGRLCNLYTDQLHSERGEHEETGMIFLSQFSLDPFHKSEENYSKELTNFTRKLFFEVVCVFVLLLLLVFVCASVHSECVVFINAAVVSVWVCVHAHMHVFVISVCGSVCVCACVSVHVFVRSEAMLCLYLLW